MGRLSTNECTYLPTPLPYISARDAGVVVGGITLVASVSLSFMPRTDHLQRKEGRIVEGGARAGEEGTWWIKEGARERGQGRGFRVYHVARDAVFFA